MNEKRRAENIKTRVGHKKAEAVIIPADIADALKQQPNTPQVRQDALQRACCGESLTKGRLSYPDNCLP